MLYYRKLALNGHNRCWAYSTVGLSATVQQNISMIDHKRIFLFWVEGGGLVLFNQIQSKCHQLFGNNSAKEWKFSSVTITRLFP